MNSPTERAAWKSRLALPASVAAGELVKVRTLIAHPMESGFRPGQDGTPIPRNIITQFVCTYNERVVFAAELFPAVAANPYLAFQFKADKTGLVRCTWTDQHGVSASAEQELVVR